jgi:hypothetical protein
MRSTLRRSAWPQIAIRRARSQQAVLARWPNARLHDCPARRHLECGNASAVEDDESVTVLAAKQTRILCERRNDPLNELVLVNDVGILICDVHTVAANEPNAQHYCRHTYKLDPSRPAIPAEDLQTEEGRFHEEGATVLTWSRPSTARDVGVDG